MRLKHIYITKEGEPMANPEMEYPGEEPNDKAFRETDDLNGYLALHIPWTVKIAKYHSGLLPFEDITLFKAATWGKGPFVFLPSTLIPVDLEVEVVDQTREIGEEKWNDGNYDNTIFKYHRKVLRIKP